MERFRDGRLQWADEEHEFPDTGLSEVPVGTPAEINEQDEFAGVLITAEEFEQVWRRAAHP